MTPLLMVLLLVNGLVIVEVFSIKDQNDALKKARSALCKSEQGVWESLNRKNGAANVAEHLLPHILTFCLGDPVVPAELKKAEDCWVVTGKDDCFLPVTTEMLSRYQNHSF